MKEKAFIYKYNTINDNIQGTHTQTTIERIIVTTLLFRRANYIKNSVPLSTSLAPLTKIATS